MTCIDNEVAQQLSLPAIDIVEMSSASQVTKQPVYPARFDLIGWNITLNAPRTVGAALKNQGIIALLGRDLLQHCILIYNGITGSISLSI